MVYTRYLLILTEKGPFLKPRNPSGYSHAIFPPPGHFPSHREARAGQTDLHTPATGAVAHHLPPKPILRELKGRGWTRQLPTCGTGIPHTHHAPSHERRQPKGIPLLPTLSCCGSTSLPAQEGLQQPKGQGLWVTGVVRAAAHLEHGVMSTQSGSGCQPCHPAR